MGKQSHSYPIQTVDADTQRAGKLPYLQFGVFVHADIARFQILQKRRNNEPSLYQTYLQLAILVHCDIARLQILEGATTKDS